MRSFWFAFCWAAAPLCSSGKSNGLLTNLLHSGGVLPGGSAQCHGGTPPPPTWQTNRVIMRSIATLYIIHTNKLYLMLTINKTEFVGSKLGRGWGSRTSVPIRKRVNLRVDCRPKQLKHAPCSQRPERTRSDPNVTCRHRIDSGMSVATQRSGASRSPSTRKQIQIASRLTAVLPPHA